MRLFRELDPSLDATLDRPPTGVPGKRTTTSQLTARASITLDVASPEAARELAAAFGPRGLGDDGPSEGPRARAAGSAPTVARAVDPLDDPFGVHLPAAPRAATTLQVSSPHDALEHEAERAADAMVRGEAATVSGGGSGAQLRREVVPQTSGEVVEWLPVQEDVAWNPQYAEAYKKKRPQGDSAQKDFDTERTADTVKAASASGGTKVRPQLTSDQVHRIIAAGGEAEAADRCAAMAGGISGAFETMLIDTAQAQADYLAHLAGESGGVLEEKEGEKRDYAPFQGRGAIQVTHPENYAKALGTLQQRAKQLDDRIIAISLRIADLQAQRDKAATPDEKAKLVAQIDAAHAEVEPLRKQLGELYEAINAIKADPKAAADPKYAFLLSAAVMQKTGAAGRTSKMGDEAAFNGNGTADSWVSGGNNGMTFDQRRVQNEGELAGIQEQLKSETDPKAIEKLHAGEAGRTRLIADMKSAKSRGEKKKNVYAAGVRILKAENAVPMEQDIYPLE